jgi:membrane protein
MGPSAWLRRRLDRVQGATNSARLVLWTIRVCLRYRVTGLAAEGAFFMLLSLPPLILGLFGGAGYVGKIVGQDAVVHLTNAVSTYAATIFTQQSISEVILPTVGDVFAQGRFDLLSVGFLLALWSGSRALNVFLDTVSIMYGQSGVRGIVRTRALSFSLYVVGILGTAVILPLVVVGPSLLARWLPDRLDWVVGLYWPVVGLAGVALLAAMFHLATPQRVRWARELPGAALTLVIWLGASVVLRAVIGASLGGSSIYGPLSAPIVILIWLYALAIAILVGAGLNAASRIVWPRPEEPTGPDEVADGEGVGGVGQIEALEQQFVHSEPPSPGSG